MKRWNNPLIPEVFHMDHQALKDQHLEWLEWISSSWLGSIVPIPPAAMGRSPVLEEIRNLETKIREKNKQIRRFGGCLPDFRESWFFIREPAVN